MNLSIKGNARILLVEVRIENLTLILVILNPLIEFYATNPAVKILRKALGPYV